MSEGERERVYTPFQLHKADAGAARHSLAYPRRDLPCRALHELPSVLPGRSTSLFVSCLLVLAGLTVRIIVSLPWTLFPLG